MSADRFGAPLTDGAIDCALAKALAVEPSPEFLARVRVRIAAEPQPSGWRLSWMYAGGACTVAIAIAVMMTQMSHPAFSAGLPTRALGSLSFLPALLPGPLSIAASSPRRARREKPTAELQALMKSNAAAATALQAHIKERNYAAIVNDSATLQQNLADSQSFWIDRKMDAALSMTRSSLDAIARLQASALAKDDAAIEKAAAAVTNTCGECHKQYRDQLPDETYEIRL